MYLSWENKLFPILEVFKNKYMTEMPSICTDLSMQVQDHMTGKRVKLILASLLHLRKEESLEIKKSALYLWVWCVHVHDFSENFKLKKNQI